MNPEDHAKQGGRGLSAHYLLIWLTEALPEFARSVSQLEGCPKGPIGLEDRRSRKFDLAFHKATLIEGPVAMTVHSTEGPIGTSLAGCTLGLRSAAKLDTLTKQRHRLR